MTLEHSIQNDARNALAGKCLAFRANVGTGWAGSGKPLRITRPMVVSVQPGDVVLRQARPFSTGLPPGFSDVFGLVPVTITQDMVGQKVAVFFGLEFKQPGKKATAEQANFLRAVNDNGGRSGVARSVDDALAVVLGDERKV